jgi:hypothetical protein
MNTDGLSISQRLGRGKLRTSRSKSLGTKLTLSEEREIVRVAEADGKSASEWAREVLLREARRGDEDALFTELIATRMLLLNLLKPLALGEKVTTKDVADISAQVRKEKRRVAQEVRQQYAATTEKEQ